jgi:sulfite reductase (NADPH) hemoprotein beta-component
VRAYLAVRHDSSETFLDTYRRLGSAPFKSALYPQEDKADAA